VSTGDAVYVLDEPTTGLHLADIKKLVDVLHRLTDAGNTVIVIEHNLGLVQTADPGHRPRARGRRCRLAHCGPRYAGGHCRTGGKLHGALPEAIPIAPGILGWARLWADHVDTGTLCACVPERRTRVNYSSPWSPGKAASGGIRCHCARRLGDKATGGGDTRQYVPQFPANGQVVQGRGASDGGGGLVLRPRQGSGLAQVG